MSAFPSSTGPLFANVAVGATLAIVTSTMFTFWTSVEVSTPSVTRIATFVVCGPSGKEHWKLPGLEIVGEPTSDPWSPHEGYPEAKLTVSAPGSLYVYE